MTAVAPSAYNTFIPDHDATNKLVVDFARNVKKFAVNRYAQIVPVKKVIGYYLKVTVEEAGRILEANLDNFVWPDGEAAPEGNDGSESFEFLPYRAVRRAFPVKLGNLTVEQASWDIIAQHARIKAQQAMTARTQLAITAATTQANHETGHVMDVTAIAGNAGTWTQSTTARQDLRRSLNTAAEKIMDATLGAVEPGDLILVINSALAAKLAETQEIVDYIKGSPDALASIKGELAKDNPNRFFDLPRTLYGYELVVEATRKVTSRKGASRAVSQVLPTATPFMCSRPGGLIGVENTPTFASLCVFEQEAMTTWKKNDEEHRRTLARIVDTVDVRLVAPAATVLFTNATS